MTNDWISFKERAPTKADYPIIVTDYTEECGDFCFENPTIKWDAWMPIRLPDPPKPKVILRHHDGREEEIEGPVYVFPISANDGDERLQAYRGFYEWIPAKRGDVASPRDHIRRRIA